MAITRLMHMKEAPGYKAQHLDNAIKYILDVRNDGAKTDYGKWVGGNSGVEYKEVLHTFLDTKKQLGKEDGRQGYHFVISFAPGEVDAQTCYNVLQDFCSEYLGDEYEYVFCVHTDQKHMHGHIVFNSVNRATACKYRYQKGDWEKYIQPVTDKICQRYDLAPLTMEKEKVGVSYAQWLSEKKDKLNWTHIIRADVDFAIQNSSDMEEFFSIMAKMDYTLDIRGYSRKHQSNYVTFIFKDENGKEHRKRSYSLTPGNLDEYSINAIADKISQKTQMEPYYEKVSELIANKMNVHLGQMSTVLKNTRTFKRIYQAVNYYKLPNPFAVPAREVRRDMLRLEKLMEDCAYLKKHPSMTFLQMQTRMDTVTEQLKAAYIERKILNEIREDVCKEVTPFLINQYRQKLKELSMCSNFDDKWERLEDEIEELEKELPPVFIENEKKLRRCEYIIEELKKEKRILGRVLETEGGKDMSLRKDMEIKPGHL